MSRFLWFTVYTVGQKGATLTMYIALPMLINLQNSLTAAKSTKFPTKPY